MVVFSSYLDFSLSFTCQPFVRKHLALFNIELHHLTPLIVALFLLLCALPYVRMFVPVWVLFLLPYVRMFVSVWVFVFASLCLDVRPSTF